MGFETEYGKKAAALLELKERGLFSTLLIFKTLPERSDFLNLMKKEFKDREDLAVRFSSSDAHLNLPRSIILDSFDKAYGFIEKNISPTLTAIVHRFIYPKYSGTLMKTNNKIYTNIVKGCWEPESSDKSNTIIFEDNKATVLFNPGEREYMIVDRDRLVKEKSLFSREKLIELARLISSKLNITKLDENTLYEFNITPENNLEFLEFRDCGRFVGEIFFPRDLLEIKTLEDFDLWDKKKDILLSLEIQRNDWLDFNNQYLRMSVNTIKLIHKA